MYSYFFITLLLLLIVPFIYYLFYWPLHQRAKLKEKFSNNRDIFSLILLGDSVLQNKLYATESQDVYTLLKEATPNNIQTYAVDNSKIVDVYSQLDNLPFDLNSNTFLFLSIGGNDLLSATENGLIDTLDPTFLSPMFASYKKLVQSIKVRAPNATLVLFDIYYPYGIKYQPFYPIIKKWNNLLYSFIGDDREKIEQSLDKKTDLIGLLKISSILTDKSDFSLGIEPSDTGGKKIANSITDYLANHQYE